MPISQMNKVNQLESHPQPEVKKAYPERQAPATLEMPPVEFGRDRPVDNFPVPIKSAPAKPVESVSQVNLVINEKFKKIEEILEEDLSEVYFNLSPQKQQEFKIRGEETTIKILDLMSRPKIHIKKIIALIRDWLKVVPGINVFFLEQVVKIKADKIINETSKKN